MSGSHHLSLVPELPAREDGFLLFQHVFVCESPDQNGSLQGLHQNVGDGPRSYLWHGGWDG